MEYTIAWMKIKQALSKEHNSIKTKSQNTNLQYQSKQIYLLMQNTKQTVIAILEDMGYKKVTLDSPTKGQIDSLDLTSLIISLEDEFNITITDEDRYKLVTIDDHIALVNSKLIPADSFVALPSIDDQIKFIQEFVVDPEMSKAIRENLIAVRMQQQIRHAAMVHPNAVYPLTPTEIGYISGMTNNPYEQK